MESSTRGAVIAETFLTPSPGAILIRNGLRGSIHSIADQIVRGETNLNTAPLLDTHENFFIALQEDLLIALLNLIKEELGTDDLFLQDLLNGQTIQEVASAAANDQTVLDPTEREKLTGLSDLQLEQQGGRMIQLALVEKKHRSLRSDEVKALRDANPKADFGLNQRSVLRGPRRPPSARNRRHDSTLFRADLWLPRRR